MSRGPRCARRWLLVALCGFFCVCPETVIAQNAVPPFVELSDSSGQPQHRPVGLFQLPTLSLSSASTHAGDEEVRADGSATAKTDSAEPFLDLRLDGSDASEDRGEMTQDSLVDSDLLTRLTAWTVIILCSCVLVLLGLRRWQKQKGLLPVTAPDSRVIQTLTLGPGRSVSLIEMSGVRALVGCDPGGLKTIVPIPESFGDTLSELSQEVPGSPLSVHSDPTVDDGGEG